MSTFISIVQEGNYVYRDSTINGYTETGSYFGCINKGEEGKGAYHDLSLVVFLSNEKTKKEDRCMVALAFGSLGYKNDYDLAALPGTRRIFLNIGNDHFIKNDFTDIESKYGIKEYCKNKELPTTLENAYEKYENVILSAGIFDPNDLEESKKILEKYIARYSKIREWLSKDQEKKANKIIYGEDLKKGNKEASEEELKQVKKLVEARRYVVLQGAPGTGKTRMAKMVAEDGELVFTQFHAETTYSDFIYGIRPRVENNLQENGADKTSARGKRIVDSNLEYEGVRGAFVEAIETAENPKNKNKKVYLIIDEINRANLSNVLGPIFYLFEPTMADTTAEVLICPGLKRKKLPDNLYVIATMNTADKSLGIVDFALRRRFAWYTMNPHVIKADRGYTFCADAFIEMKEIFDKYAADDELNLMPGHAYFVTKENNDKTSYASNDKISEQMGMRLEYEVMPLIKEYLADGFIPRAKDVLENYFRKWIKKEMYR